MVLAFFVGMDSFSRCFAARDARAARNGALLAAVLIIPLAVAAVWLGLAAAVLYPDHASSGSSVLATFVLDAFPPGLKGLMLVARPVGRSCPRRDICILTASANYTRDIHQRYLRPDLSPKDMLRLGIIASGVFGALSMLLAWKMRDIIDILQLGFTHQCRGPVPADGRSRCTRSACRRAPRSGASPPRWRR